METVHTAQGQGVIRRHHGEVDGVGLGELHDGGDVLSADLGNAHGVLGDAAVARQGVNGLYAGIFFQLFDNGVLAATAADDQKIHIVQVLLAKNLPKTIRISIIFAAACTRQKYPDLCALGRTNQ